MELILSFSVRKARGYDGISLRTIKKIKFSLVPVLTYLIKLTFKSSKFPDCLKISRVTDSIIYNYRPFSILPALFVESFIYSNSKISGL